MKPLRALEHWTLKVQNSMGIAVICKVGFWNRQLAILKFKHVAQSFVNQGLVYQRAPKENETRHNRQTLHK